MKDSTSAAQSNLAAEEARLSATLVAGVPRPKDLVAEAQRLRAAAAKDFSPARAAAALALACERWRTPGYQPRLAAIARIAATRGWSEKLVSASLDALIAPFTQAALARLAENVAAPFTGLIGLIMPGNIPGAGLHELVAGFVAGAPIIVKSASAEQVFFAQFARTLQDLDADAGARIAVFNWGRDREDLTSALRTSCDLLAVFGDDETVAQLAGAAPVRPCAASRETGRENFAGFGHRLSAAIVAGAALESPARCGAVVRSLARDITLFEQHGCLSPHHIFVEDTPAMGARDFAARLAVAMDEITRELPPPDRLGLEDAAALRRARESARWRRIGGHDVALWEGATLEWTVIYDHSASLRTSPGFRTVYVSPYNDLTDLKRRFAPASGRLEACALADFAEPAGPPRALVEELGASYICAPGQMQSPPPAWEHGGGAFIRMVLGARSR
jgi:hypothetical protein